MFFLIAANGLRLGDGGVIEAQKFSFAQMLNRITNVDFLHVSHTFAKPMLAVRAFTLTIFC